jgi:hypothetical protein
MQSPMFSTTVNPAGYWGLWYEVTTEEEVAAPRAREDVNN